MPRSRPWTPATARYSYRAARVLEVVEHDVLVYKEPLSTRCTVSARSTSTLNVSTRTRPTLARPVPPWGSSDLAGRCISSPPPPFSSSGFKPVSNSDRTLLSSCSSTPKATYRQTPTEHEPSVTIHLARTAHSRPSCLRSRRAEERLIYRLFEVRSSKDWEARKRRVFEELGGSSSNDNKALAEMKKSFDARGSLAASTGPSLTLRMEKQMMAYDRAVVTVVKTTQRSSTECL